MIWILFWYKIWNEELFSSKSYIIQMLNGSTKFSDASNQGWLHPLFNCQKLLPHWEVLWNMKEKTIEYFSIWAEMGLVSRFSKVDTASMPRAFLNNYVFKDLCMYVGN